MPRQNSTGRSSDITVNSTGIKTAWSVSNVTAPATIGNEFTIAIPSTAKAFQIRVRGPGKLQITDTTGQTNTKFWTVMPGACYREEQLSLGGAITLYCQANKSSAIVEVITWT